MQFQNTIPGMGNKFNKTLRIKIASKKVTTQAYHMYDFWIYSFSYYTSLSEYVF